MMKKVFLLVSLFAALSLFHCTLEQPLPGGYELLDRENVGGVMPPVTLQAEETAIYWDQRVVGYTSSLLLGMHDHLTSFVIINSTNFEFIDTTAIASVELKLTPVHVYGDHGDLNLSFHEIQEDWNEGLVTWEDMQSQFTSEPFETMSITVVDTEMVSIPFTNIDFFTELISEMQTDSTDTKGMLITVQETDAAAEFYSSDASTGTPYFQVVTYNSEGGLDTSFVQLSADANLVSFENELEEGQVEHNPDRLRIGNGSGFHALLKFDLDEIPKDATIHQALLTMFVDQEMSETKSSGLEVAPITVTGDSLWQSMDSIELDSASTRYTDFAISTVDTFVIESLNALYVMSSIVNNQNHEKVGNYGVALVPEGIASDMQEMYFYTGNDDPALKPTLRITYSMPAGGRFVEDY